MLTKLRVIDGGPSGTEKEIAVIKRRMAAATRRKTHQQRKEHEATEEEEIDFGRRVAELRKRLGLSQSEFAEAYGLDVRTLRNWEQGRCSPDSGMRQYLAVIDAAPDTLALISGYVSEQKAR
jgi:DNA-binding transcriptional regulator YiaG